MGQKIGKLSAVRVAALAKREVRAMHGDGGGLWLQVTPGGASWCFRYRVAGRTPRDGPRPGAYHQPGRGAGEGSGVP